MKKTNAIKLAEEKFSIELSLLNTHFSRVNVSKPVWWFEIPISKIENPHLSEINLLIEKDGKIDLLIVPTSFFQENYAGFKVRTEKQVVCLELDITTIQNIVGSDKLGFKQFLR